MGMGWRCWDGGDRVVLLGRRGYTAGQEDICHLAFLDGMRKHGCIL